MRIGEIIQQTVFIGHVAQIDILTIQFADAITIRIHDSCIIQNFLCFFRIIGIRILKFFIAVAQIAWQYSKSRCIQPSDGIRITDCVIINAHENCLTQRLIGKNSIKIHPGKTSADTRRNIHIKIRIFLEFLNICNIRDIFYQIHLTALQSHRFSRSITHKKNFHLIIRNFLAVVRVLDHIVTHSDAIELFNHIRSCTDCTIVKILHIFYIQNCHRRMCQLTRQVCIRLGSNNRDRIRIIIGCNSRFEFQIFFRFRGTGRSHLFQIVKSFLHFRRCQRTAVRKCNVFFQCNDPFRVFIVDSITFCQPWFHFHRIIEFKKTFTDAVTHAVPTGTFSGNGIDRTIVVHLAPKIQDFFTFCCLFTFRTAVTCTAIVAAASAAACHGSHKHHCSQKYG